MEHKSSGEQGMEQLDRRPKVNESGKLTWNVWDQTVTVRKECVDIVLLMTGDRDQ